MLCAFGSAALCISVGLSTSLHLLAAVLQVYTFALEPLYQQAAADEKLLSPVRRSRQLSEAAVTGWELMLIMEYCAEVRR